ncbi:ATP-grasp domain-containing protein [Dorea sp.]
MRKKRILLLGGSAQQIVAIKTAKKLGYYTILCDFLPDNPGQYVADKFYLVSTTDKSEVLKVAEKESVDGVLAYASDPAAPTAAYVAERLDLPGSPYKSVEILCNKDQFREFLAENGFCTPKAKGYSDIAEAQNDLKNGIFKYPIIVKPVDSSGSKGVSRIDTFDEANAKLEYAMSFSRGRKIIIEEFVEKFGYQIAGDGLSIDGKLVFRYFANDHFNTKCVNPFVPISASFPYNMPREVQDKIQGEIQRLLDLLHMQTTTYNFDMRIDKDYNVYLMEVAPRDGGNYIPDVIKYATGIDLVECSVKAAMGEKIELKDVNPRGYYSYFAVHSLEDGILNEIAFTEEGSKHIIENHLIKKAGDKVKAFTGANTTLGCLIMKFDNMEQMLHMMDYSEEWCKVKLLENL